jgi:hypothetical protein
MPQISESNNHSQSMNVCFTCKVTATWDVDNNKILHTYRFKEYGNGYEEEMKIAVEYFKENYDEWKTTW